ncbi:MAG: MBL fold metallo-hydrolase [Pseudomonadota bacterium]
MTNIYLSDGRLQMVDRVAPRVHRLTAPNPGPLTGRGTNTYVLGSDQQFVIDPGPDDDAHLDAILTVAPNPQAILVTHSHIDHTALVPRLAAATGAAVWAFGDSFTGRHDLPDLGPTFAEGDGTDQNFACDHNIKDGQVLTFGDVHLTALWTPGHFPNHLCFDRGDVLFSGDVVMGWSTTLVSPPEGSVTQFMAACQRLEMLGPKPYLPGHGDLVDDGAARALELRLHRQTREDQILAALTDMPQSAAALTKQIYHDVPVHLHPAAERNVLAHLVALIHADKAQTAGPLSPSALFATNP